MAFVVVEDIVGIAGDIDFGNNIALLDDPVVTIERLAPYTVTAHIKNMGVEVTNEGFLLSEVLLGEGYLDIPGLVKMVRQARPQAHFMLEMITRDPLKVPCLSDDYWTSFSDRNGRYLARTLRFVQNNMSSRSLPRVSKLSHEEQVHVEEQNIAACLQYARENLDF